MGNVDLLHLPDTEISGQSASVGNVDLLHLPDTEINEQGAFGAALAGRTRRCCCV